MKETLIIKTGAAGDVVRTTVLLAALDGNVTWVIDEKYQDILPGGHPQLKKIIALQHAGALLENDSFDLIISLEEDMECAKLAGSVKAGKITGVYEEHGLLKYTEDSSGWFDMSLISSKGKAVANRLKSENKSSYQQMLFEMLGLTFHGEPYCIYRNETIEPRANAIGLEKRSGTRWPNKRWGGYDKIQEKLSAAGYDILILSQRSTLKEYLDDIAGCSYIISGDTLAMHVSLGYGKPCIGIFTCTSPEEIYDYGLLQKKASPLLTEFFYSNKYSERASNAIPAIEIEEAASSLFRRR